MARRFLVAVLIASSCADASTASTAPAGTSPELDALLERARHVHSFQATFRLLSPDEPPATVRFDYEHPGSLRVEQNCDGESITTLVHGAVFAARVHGAPTDGHARIDVADLFTAFEPVEWTLASEVGPDARSETPDATSSWTAHLGFDWSYDSAADEGTFSLFAAAQEAAPSTPFAWLDTLRRKGAKPNAVGDDFVFDTDDGHFTATVSRDGVLRRLVARTGKGTTTVEAERFAVDVPIDPARLDLDGVGDEGADLSAPFRRQFVEDYWKELRTRGLEATGPPRDGAPWTDATRAKAATFLHALYEVGLCELLKDDVVLTDEWLDEITDAVVSRRTSGSSNDDVGATIREAKEELIARLDELEHTKVARLAARPATTLPAEAATELQRLERETAKQVFRDVIRAPRVGRLDQLENSATSVDH